MVWGLVSCLAGARLSGLSGLSGEGRPLTHTHTRTHTRTHGQWFGGWSPVWLVASSGGAGADGPSPLKCLKRLKRGGAATDTNTHTHTHTRTHGHHN